jgi:DNA gyrase subunit A
MADQEPNQPPATMTHAQGHILATEITAEMKQSYLDYAMSVIVARALPDIRDGLKPVHRRILYAMHGMGLYSHAAFTKSAKVVGETMGKYHPHGDSAIYDSLVRMAQDFSLRYPLVNGHGNFGSVDGDPPAAMRYTEVKLKPIALEMLADINKETVSFVDNFDSSIQEPEFLPAKLPNLLLMGADGIAVGMATKIPPHNLTEVVEALKTILNKAEIEDLEPPADQSPEVVEASLLAGKIRSQISSEELLEIVKGPDFPTGAEIYNWSEITKAYTTGKGSITVRAKVAIEEDKKERYRIVVNEIPYQVNKSRLIKHMADLVRNKKLKGISDIRDESDRRGLQIVIELQKNTRPKSVLNNLFAKTDLQTSFPVNMVALVDGTPQLLSLKTILEEFLKHRQLVVIRRSQFELKEARLRAHILEGLMIALNNLDAVIETIKKSKDADTAKTNLMERFKLSDPQAQAILDMQLRRLAALERQKIEDEYQMIKELIDYLVDLLHHPTKILKVIDGELDDLNKHYGDERRTKVFKKSLDKFSEEDLIPDKPAIITMTKAGYIKRLPPETYRAQRRGGKGVSGMATKDEDEIAYLVSATTHDDILFFSDKGRVFKQKVYELPETSRQAKGQAVINLINIEPDEKIQSILAVKDLKNSQGFLFMATQRGIVKKTPMAQFVNIRSSGIIAIELEPQDRLIRVKQTAGQDHILLVSQNGMSIKFAEKDVRPMGRSTRGVKGITLKPSDQLVTMETFSAQISYPTDKRKKHFQELLIVTSRGIGKRTPVTDFPMQKRAGIGVKAAKINDKTGKIICAMMVDQLYDQVMLTSKKAQVIKLPLKNIKTLGRNTQGVILMRFNKSLDQLAAVTCLLKDDEPELSSAPTNLDVKTADKTD